MEGISLVNFRFPSMDHGKVGTYKCAKEGRRGALPRAAQVRVRGVASDVSRVFLSRMCTTFNALRRINVLFGKNGRCFKPRV